MSSLDLNELNNIIEGYTRPVDTKAREAARTGVPSLDLNLGGGLPTGITEIFGSDSSGKTALVGQIAAHNQRAGRQVAWVASEKIDPSYLDRLGVIRKYLPIIPATDVSEFLRAFDRAVVVLDSLTAVRLPDVVDWNAFVYEYLLGLRRGIRPGQCVIATSQIRAKRSVVPTRRFSGTESANRYTSDLFACRLELSREQVDTFGYTQIVKIESNILASPSRYLKFKVTKGYGINRAYDLIYTAHSLGVLERRGSSYYFGDQRIGVGVESAAMAVSGCRELESEIVQRVLSRA